MSSTPPSSSYFGGSSSSFEGPVSSDGTYSSSYPGARVGKHGSKKKGKGIAGGKVVGYVRPGNLFDENVRRAVRKWCENTGPGRAIAWARDVRGRKEKLGVYAEDYGFGQSEEGGEEVGEADDEEQEVKGRSRKAREVSESGEEGGEETQSETVQGRVGTYPVAHQNARFVAYPTTYLPSNMPTDPEERRTTAAWHREYQMRSQQQGFQAINDVPLVHGQAWMPRQPGWRRQ